MPSRPRFSVVLPVYNRAHTLAGAVRSVLAQTAGDWELIVVDDGSNDDVAGALVDVGDARIRLVTRTENGGVAAAGNTGLAQCRGEYVAFLHSDDRFAPAKLEHQAAVLDAAPPDVIAVESAFVAAGTTTVTPPSLAGGLDEFLTLAASVHLVPMLFRRDAVAALGFDDGLRAWEDWDLVARCLQRGRVERTGEVVAELQRAGEGRLVDTPWMVHGLEHLLDKYRSELAARPRVRALWHLQLARRHLRAGSVPDARRHLVRCVRDDPRRARMLAPAAATLFGLRAGRHAWRLSENLARRVDGRQNRPTVPAGSG